MRLEGSLVKAKFAVAPLGNAQQQSSVVVIGM
jgi:hypothetical protein